MLRFTHISAISLVVLVGLIVARYELAISSWWYTLPILFWLVLTLIGSFHIRWNYHLNALHANTSIEKNTVSLTFDDGPNKDFTPKVLELLKCYEAKATFFCIGSKVAANPGVLMAILKDGHTVGNHTYSHSNRFGFFSTLKVVRELRETIALVLKYSDKEMRLYRPAFGVTNPNIKKAVAQEGLITVGWSIRSYDTTRLPEQKVLQRITDKISRGDIILLHDTSVKSLAVLEQLLIFLQRKNLQSVPVDQLLNIQAYA